MAATCAVCLTPIVKADKFVITGSEVTHAVCLGRQTIGTKRRLKIIEQTAEIAELRTQVAALQATGVRVLREESLRRQQAELRESDYRRQRDEARRERDQALADRDAAQREARLHQALGPAPARPISPPADAPPVQAPVPAKDGRDDAEIRFSLLEI